jgi:hypothetical protein
MIVGYEPEECICNQGKDSLDHLSDRPVKATCDVLSIGTPRNSEKDDSQG